LGAHQKFELALSRIESRRYEQAEMGTPGMLIGCQFTTAGFAMIKVGVGVMSSAGGGEDEQWQAKMREWVDVVPVEDKK